MNNFLWAALLAVAAPSVASASTFVVSGQIVPVGAPSENSVSVDYWSFDVETYGTVTIDTLSMDYFDYYMDPYIYLFSDDGDLSSDDYIAQNDDSYETYDDGSVHGFDSYLSMNLSAGAYVLAISAYFFGTDAAVSGINDETSYPDCSAAVTGPCDHADYQITFSGVSSVTGGSVVPTTPVPLPPAAALLGGAVFGLGALRRFGRV